MTGGEGGSKGGGGGSDGMGGGVKGGTGGCDGEGGAKQPTLMALSPEKRKFRPRPMSASMLGPLP